MRTKLQAIFFALLAAVFYAINTPFSKLLMEYVPSTYMAGFLYLGAGVGVGAMYLVRSGHGTLEERLTRKDLPYTIGMIVLDIFAPIFLMLGIRLGSASSASLLGNFEIVATTLIALIIFRENVTGRLWGAIGLITAASIVLSMDGIGHIGFSAGSLFVLLATACWGLENNCTRKISDKSTYQIVILKGFFSGGGACLIAAISGEHFPQLRYVISAMILGFIAYGLSIFLYIRAQRSLGAAKTSAYYAAAPFVGAALSFMLLGEQLTVHYAAALVLMIAGTVFVIWDTMVKHHAHLHEHSVTHTHNGITHTHVICHEHGHDHFLEDGIHGHHHSERELMEELEGSHHS